ncbi:MAG TPA: tripartite tricarboxylate transporter substrate binding protein [Xanthobacteraceae bacterium]|jgi:tripartite-type tricarboxylate transporter receptor subunit TctC|nr:tripartite tricarboxylate transporter substrate binding protein [Xanthobacteraceae bacterium]
MRKRATFALIRPGAWAVVLTLIGTAMHAQGTAETDDFPSRPIKIVVPYAAGGPSDTGARLVQSGLTKALGQPVYIDNRGGGGGLNGTETFLSGDLDGYTMLNAGIAPMTIIPWIKKVSYVADHDFLAIGTVWRSAQTLVVRKSLGVKTLAEFVAYAKANPGKVAIGSAGVGTVSHLGSLLLQREAGIKLVHVPFRSTSESLPLLMSGQLDGLFGDATTVAPQVKAGTIVALGVAAPERTPALPDTPTIAEAGYAEVQAEGWHGLVVSSKTPPSHVSRLREALRAAQSDPAYQERLKAMDATVGALGADALQKLIETDSAKWGAIIKAANITTAE